MKCLECKNKEATCCNDCAVILANKCSDCERHSVVLNIIDYLLHKCPDKNNIAIIEITKEIKKEFLNEKM